MSESQTRKRWRTRIHAMMLDGCEEGWLDDFMQTPELSLAEKAEENPNYRLAVVEPRFIDTYVAGTAGYRWEDTRREWAVVKMEEK